MSNIQSTLRFFWRAVLVAFGYIAGLILAELIASQPRFHVSVEASRETSFIQIFIASLLLGVFLGPFASRLTLNHRQHFILWGSLILFNLGSVIIEGAYFAPDLVSLPIPFLLVQQFLASAGAALIISLIFAESKLSVSWKKVIQTRPWHSWAWRFIASAGSYLMFYFLIGGLTYQLVTRPYYEVYVGGLDVPASDIILKVEAVRSLFIVLSVFLFLLSVQGSRLWLMATTGWLLFAIGGIVPLIWQIGLLPPFLVAASCVEIFFQNFLTGVVAARLMAIEKN